MKKAVIQEKHEEICDTEISYVGQAQRKLLYRAYTIHPVIQGRHEQNCDTGQTRRKHFYGADIRKTVIKVSYEESCDKELI